MPDIRDYGYGDSNPYVTGAPRVKGEAKDVPPCPNCGCATLYHIAVDVRGVPMFGDGVGNYVGCPACPWASPMLMVRVDGRREDRC